MNRKNFLKQAGMMTAGAAASPFIRLDAAEKPKKGHTPQSEIAKVSVSDGMCKITPTDNGQALINPGMGFVTPFYSCEISIYGSRLSPSDTADNFPGLSTVYLRLPWSFVEPEEGQFNWEILDTPAQRWINKGKKVSLRITSTENWIYQATPYWVFEAGAKGYEVWNGSVIEPDYDDPVYLEKVENFVRALAERYDNNPNVETVDVGHFGMWGEMHTVMTTPLHGHKWGFESVKRIIDIHLRHFKNTQLFVLDDADGVYWQPVNHPTPVADYALSKGIGLRDDSILVSKAPENWAHDWLAQRFWPTIPVFLELEHYGLTSARGNFDSELWVKSVEAYHASHMLAHGWPQEILDAERPAIDRINRRLGYRLRMVSVAWPQSVDLGAELLISYSMMNAGVAPCYKGGFPCFTIKDGEDGLVSVLVDDAMNVKTLPVGEPEKAGLISHTARFRVAPALRGKGRDPESAKFYRAAPAGEFDLFVSVGKKDGTPLYELPYGEHDGHKRYKIGKITLSGERPLPHIRINDQIKGIIEKKQREKTS